MTLQMESIWIFIGAGALVLALFALIVITGRHAREIDIRSGLHRRGDKKYLTDH
jgi:hypothetical protein